MNKLFTASALLATFVAAQNASSTVTLHTCNPSYTYADGVCTSTDGGYYLEPYTFPTPTSTMITLHTCNPTYTYADGVCTSTDGGYYLEPYSIPTPTSTHSLSTMIEASYICLPGMSTYTNAPGSTCVEVSGIYTFVPEVTVTEVVQTFTTWCPEATTIVTNGMTYTATAGQTITITNCPCTITPQVTSPPVTPAPVTPATMTSPNNSTSPNSSVPPVQPFTGAAPRATAVAGLLAVIAGALAI